MYIFSKKYLNSSILVCCPKEKYNIPQPLRIMYDDYEVSKWDYK